MVSYVAEEVSVWILIKFVLDSLGNANYWEVVFREIRYCEWDGKCLRNGVRGINSLM